ncbi:MAG: S8 family serine peptidase, partial [Acidobacteria bacterium]|nr:S8 family serine peptidase [Acidobacteriota bacterium]
MRNLARSTLISLVLIVLTVLAVSFKGGAAAGPPAAPTTPHSASGPGRTEGYVPGEILVQLSEPFASQARGRLGVGFRIVNERMGIPSMDDLASQFGVREILSFRARVRPNSPLADFYQIRLGGGRSALEAVAAYRKDPAVRAAQLNYLYTQDLTPNDTLYAQQYAHQRTSAEAGWDITTGTGANPVKIAIIGQGMELTHPDLQANIVAGYDFYDGDNDPSPGSSSEGHETSVAGCAAAVTNNALGVAGACWGCGIMPLRV